LRDSAACSAAGVRKPPKEETALGDVGRYRVIELSRVKQPSDATAKGHPPATHETKFRSVRDSKPGFSELAVPR